MTALGSTFETNEPSLGDLLKEIDAGASQLPDFQRPWVWEDQRIRKLVASVSLSYPIGAIMLMEVGDETRFAPRAFEGTAFQDPKPRPKRLVLDGQQRLTSLYGALKSGRALKTKTEKGDEIVRWYYLDMRKALAEGVDHEDRTEAIVAVPEDRRIKKDFDRVIELDLSTRELEIDAHMFPLSIMLDEVTADAWCEDYRDKHGATKEVNAFLSRFGREIRNAFRQYKVPVIELMSGTRKEAVCQVFENVNTGGVALTVFELITATFAADDFRLRADWDKRRSKGVKEKKLAPLGDHDVLEDVNGEVFLQALALYTTYLRNREGKGAVGAKRRDMLKLTLGDYQAHADRLHQAFLGAARLLIREKVFTSRNLPYVGQLVPMAGILAVLGDAWETDAVKQKLARWYWCGVFGELYGSAIEARFALDIQQVPAWIEGGNEPRTVADANFAPTRLLSMQSRQSAAYKGLMARLMDAGSLDLRTGDPIQLTTHMEDDVDIHHIFPADYCEKQGYDRRQWNSIVNKAPLTARTNRKIGKKAPSEYLTRFGKDLGQDRLDDILRSHSIDPGKARCDDFQGFVLGRAAALLDLIEKATGKAVAGRDSEETAKAFGGLLIDGSARPLPTTDRLFERYVVVERLLAGGMSDCFKVRGPDGEMLFLKKVPIQGIASDALRREIDIYARLERCEASGVLRVHGIERSDTHLALLTELADGGSLAQHVQAAGGTLTPSLAKPIATTVLEALRELHALGIVHRDLKPENVLRCRGQWKLADFGIAKSLARLVTQDRTFQGHGTPGFAPPEQVDGAEANPSADIYAFGKLLAYLITGQTDVDRVMHPSWTRIARACTARDPAARPLLDAVASDLTQIMV